MMAREDVAVKVGHDGATEPLRLRMQEAMRQYTKTHTNEIVFFVSFY